MEAEIQPPYITAYKSQTYLGPSKSHVLKECPNWAKNPMKWVMFIIGSSSSFIFRNVHFEMSNYILQIQYTVQKETSEA